MIDAVRAVGLRKTYGTGAGAVIALDDVDLTLRPGTVAALLGPSGSGKSTLIKALGFVSPADRGQLYFADQLVVSDGVALADLARLRRRHLGFVFQKANLTSFLTARENVEIACEFGGKPDGRRRAREMLSGGEQQRVAIARALANEPALVLADEPTAALDSKRSRSVMALFRKVAHERGAAVLVVTHDHRALDVFDLIYEMEDGRLRPAAPSVAAPGHVEPGPSGGATRPGPNEQG